MDHLVAVISAQWLKTGGGRPVIRIYLGPLSLDSVSTTNMLSSAINGGLQTYNFFSNLFNLKMSGSNSDVFASLLSPTTRNDISSYVTSYFQFSLLSKQPLFYLQSRLVVTAIGLNKAGSPAQHESLAVWVQDVLTSQSHEFVIEHMPSNVARSRFSAFSQFPDSDAVLESILKAVRNMKSLTLQLAESISTAFEVERALAESEEIQIPLLPLTGIYDSDPSPLTPPSPPNTLALIDSLTTTLARAVAVARATSGSVSPQSLAADTISVLSLES